MEWNGTECDDNTFDDGANRITKEESMRFRRYLQASAERFFVKPSRYIADEVKRSFVSEESPEVSSKEVLPKSVRSDYFAAAALARVDLEALEINDALNAGPMILKLEDFSLTCSERASQLISSCGMLNEYCKMVKGSFRDTGKIKLFVATAIAAALRIIIEDETMCVLPLATLRTLFAFSHPLGANRTSLSHDLDSHWLSAITTLRSMSQPVSPGKTAQDVICVWFAGVDEEVLSLNPHSLKIWISEHPVRQAVAAAACEVVLQRSVSARFADNVAWWRVLKEHAVDAAKEAVHWADTCVDRSHPACECVFAATRETFALIAVIEGCRRSVLDVAAPRVSAHFVVLVKMNMVSAVFPGSYSWSTPSLRLLAFLASNLWAPKQPHTMTSFAKKNKGAVTIRCPECGQRVHSSREIHHARKHQSALRKRALSPTSDNDGNSSGRVSTLAPVVYSLLDDPLCSNSDMKVEAIQRAPTWRELLDAQIPPLVSTADAVTPRLLQPAEVSWTRLRYWASVVPNASRYASQEKNRQSTPSLHASSFVGNFVTVDAPKVGASTSRSVEIIQLLPLGVDDEAHLCGYLVNDELERTLREKTMDEPHCNKIT